ncbi:hypothetical protein D3C81_1887940 [compost metagenome]
MGDHGRGYSRSGSAPQPTAFPKAPAPAAPAASDQPLSKEQWQQQLEQLSRETGLSYEEYQRRYREIVGR